MPSPATAAPRVPPAAERTLEDRYGRRRQVGIDRRVAWIAAVLLVAGGVAVLLFGGWQTTSRLEFRDLGYTVDEPGTAQARYEVTADPGTPVACVVEALNPAFATVGWKVVELAPSERRTRALVTDLITTGEATTARVRQCWIPHSAVPEAAPRSPVPEHPARADAAGPLLD